MVTVNEVFRDFVIDGMPSSGANKPKKSEIRELLSAVVAGNADGIYDFIPASNTGTGSPNAIKATTAVALPATPNGALIAVNIFETNTASPVTVSFNGGAALTVKTSSGNDISVGGLTAGMIAAGYVSGATFRLLTDQASAAVLAGAEAAKSAAEAVMTTVIDPQFATKATAEAYAPDVAPDYIRTAGEATAGDGLGALYKKAVVEPATGMKLSITLSDGFTVVWYEEAIPPAGVRSRSTLLHQKMIVCLGTGQSNMEGSGSGGDMTLNQRVFAWNGAEIVVADPTKAPFPTNANNNLLFHAGKRLQEKTGRDILLILVAEGGQKIERWLEGDADHHLWTDIVTDVPAALAAAGLSYVDAVLWHQGEANNSDGAIVYRNKLMAVKGQMKAQNWWLDGHTYFLAGELVDEPDNGMRGQTFGLRLATEVDGEIGIVSSFGLSGKLGEHIHFSGESLVEIGHRYADLLLVPRAPSVTATPARHALSNIYFTIAKDGSGDFDDLAKAFDFFSTVTFAPAARGIVTIGAGAWSLAAGLRTTFIGSAWEFSGVLAAGFTQPVKADFTGVKATDLAMLRGKYLTEIAFAEHGLILGGNNGGKWNDILFTAVNPTLQTCGIRSDDPNLPKAAGNAFANFENVAIHGWDGPTCRGIYSTDGSGINAALVTISHCTAGLYASTGARIAANGILLAYVTDVEIQAAYQSFIAANGADIVGFSGTSFSATDGSGIDARGADNNTPSTVARDGKIWI